MGVAQAPISVADALRHAHQLCATRRHAEAEPYLRMVLRVQPRHFDALHALGLCLLERGEYAQARKRIADAVRMEPRLPCGHVSLGHALRSLNRIDDAIASFRRAFELDPSDFEALRACGSALEEQGKYQDAIAVFERALALQPADFVANCARANCLLMLHRYEAAVAGFDRALATKPGNPEASQNRAVALTPIRPAQALAAFDPVIAGSTGSFQARAISNRGNAFSELDRLEEALACHEQALQIDPDLFEARFCRAAALHGLNRLDEAVRAYDEAIGLNPAAADARMFRSMALLSAGRFDEGWVQYEWRGDGIRRLSPAQPDRRRWLGDGDPSGRTVLLYNEQGYGDTIQFARYARLLLARGARVILRVQRPLASLMARLDPAIRVVESDRDAGPFDLCCPIMSLPLAFGTRGETIPAPVPYLGADAGRVESWRRRIGAAAGPRIGLAWAGNAANVNDRRRSIALSRLAPLLSLASAKFIVLQNELRPGDRELLSTWPAVEHFDREIRDFEDVAALIELCDLVIGVDTAVVHLAGALAKPVWVLLPFAPDFRWMLGREDTPWYPSARLFRQARTGEWEPVVQRLAEEMGRTAFRQGAAA